MATLYEIDKSIEQMLNNGFVFNEETGEIDTLLTAETLDLMLEEKLEDYGIYIKQLNADSKAIDDEIKALQKRKEAKSKLSKRLSDTLLAFMLKHNKKRIETPRIDVRTRATKRVVIDDEEALLEYCKVNNKDDCFTIKLEQKLNKPAIRRQISDFQGMAHLETNNTVNIK